VGHLRIPSRTPDRERKVKVIILITTFVAAIA
jgi:hypothetical protein